jgi:hypothetical protein
MTVRYTESQIITTFDHHGVEITHEVDRRGEDYGMDVSFYFDGELHSGYGCVDEARNAIDELVYEAEAREEAEYEYRRTRTSLCAGWWA